MQGYIGQGQGNKQWDTYDKLEVNDLLDDKLDSDSIATDNEVQQDVRDLISGGDGIDYNSSTGEITNSDISTFTDVTTDTLNIGDAVIDWNIDEGTINIGYDGVSLQVGQEQHFYAKATEAISNGDVVMFAGAQGGHLLIKKADVTVPGFIDQWIVGVATNDIANNVFGYVTTTGKVRNLDTSSFTEGSLLYLDPNNPGQLTSTKPQKDILIAAVTRSHQDEGTILVRIDFGVHLEDAHDVSISGLQNGDLLTYNSSTSKWENQPLDSSILTDSDIGSTVQGYNVNTVVDGSYVHTDNNYTSGEKSKLAGIEAGAQVNVDETVTSLDLTANILTYTDENGTDTDIDLSLYLDDTNLARLVSGIYNSGTQELVFTRDDTSTFSIDASMFFDDTNLVTSVNGSTGAVVIDAYTQAQADSLLDNKVDKISSTDNAIARFNGTTGQLQDSGVTIDDTGRLTSDTRLTVSNSSDSVTIGQWDTITHRLEYVNRPLRVTGYGSNTDIIFANNNDSEKMRIDSAGRVTMPYQPSFSAIKNGHQYPVSGQRLPITPWTSQTNTGGHFNVSNGRFTAPINGTYYFIVSVMLDNNDTGDYQISWYKNETMYVNSNDHVNTSAVYVQTTVPCLVELSAGDYMDARLYNSTSTSSFIYQSNYTHIHGYLIG